jgi:hypothetical protein
MVLPLAAGMFRQTWTGVRMRLFAGDDWAEDVRHEVACCE